MHSETRKRIFQSLLYVFALLGVGAALYTFISVFNTSLTTTVQAQQDPFLDRRISQLEQRFSFIETRINRIEQTAVSQRITPNITDNSDTEIRLLRAQNEALQLRLAEAECALAKLDERTLGSAARQTQKRATAVENDGCRANPGTPIRLSARP